MGLFFKRRRVKPVFVGSQGNDLTRGMYVFHLDYDNGEILKKKFYESQANPVSFFRRERYIFVCYANNTGRSIDGGLWQYASMDLQFGLTAKVTDQGKTYAGSYVNEERSYAYAVDYHNGEVVTLPISKQKIIKVSQHIQHSGHSVDPRFQSQAHPSFIDKMPDYNGMVVCDLGLDEVFVYNIIEDGKLEKDEERSFKVEPGSGPKKIIFSHDHRFAYVLCSLDSSVAVYQYLDGHFTFVQKVKSYPQDEECKNTATDFLMTEDMHYLFVCNKGHDSISTFKVDQNTGELEYFEYMETDENPVAMILIMDRWLIAACQKGGSIESFEIRRHEYRGVLFETHFSYAVTEPVCLIEGRGI